MTASPPPRVRRRVCGFSYTLGALTVLLFLLPPVLRAGYKVGWRNLALDARDTLFFWRPKEARILDLTPSLVEDLKTLGAIVEKAGNPTGGKKHDNLLVRPEPVRGYELRPGVRLRVDILVPEDPWNLNPPSIFLPADRPVPPALERWISERSRVRYDCSTDAEGFRTTLPGTAAPRRLLLVGDSVTFGVGVDDRSTVASALQRRFGDRIRVVNAGVGGYTGRKACAYARALADSGEWAGLVYIACQNDFMGTKGRGDWVASAEGTVDEFAGIKDRFGGRIAVVLHTYLEYHMRALLQRKGWPEEWNAKTAGLRAALPDLCRNAGFLFADWTDAVEEHRLARATGFAPFALYVDQCHLSAEGNDLLAEKIAGLVEAWDSP